MDMSSMVREISTKKPQSQTPTQLNDDLINEVINHLPAISNFRLKCVSKQWFSLNTEALKCKSQTLMTSGIFYASPKGTKTKLCVKYAKIQKGGNEYSCIDGTLSFLPKHLNTRIYGSCNGLLLCEGWDKPDRSIYLSDQTSCLYVCNPATRSWAKIPYDYTKAFLAILLDFNPLVSVHFNVITIRSCSGRSHQYAFEVFSSKTGEWKVSQVTNPMLRGYTIRNYATVIYKGIIFWINLENTDVIGFDKEGNYSHRIELPGKSHQKDPCFFSCLGPSGGSVCQAGGFLHYYYKSGSEFSVWKLIDYESGSWLLKNNFRITGSLRKIQDLKFLPDMEDVLLLRIKDKMHSYNMKTARMVELCSLHSPLYYFLYSPCYLEGFWQQSRK